MLENNYASIGKSVLIRAIGLQENHKIIHELDRKASGCFSCPHFKQSLKNPSCQKCSQCTARKYKNDTYTNEKNRYGYQPRMTLCAAKLFTYLHFQVTGQGIVENLLIRSAAYRLHMSCRSVHNSLRSLKENGYIEYQKNRPGSYLVLLNDYQEYFKKAAEGGRGYLVFSRSFFEDSIISSAGINELRLRIRMYLNVDEKKYLPVLPETFLTDTKKVSDVCRYFPRYMKPVHIRRLIEKESHVFQISEQNGSLTYSLDQTYYGEVQKKAYKAECLSKLEDAFSGINQALTAVFENHASAATVPVYLTHHVISAKLCNTAFDLNLSAKDTEDLLSLAVQYGYDQMFAHLKHLFATTKEFSSLENHYGEYVRFSIEHELCAA